MFDLGFQSVTSFSAIQIKSRRVFEGVRRGMTKQKLNLRDIRMLLVDSDRYGVAVLIQMLHGLGLDRIKTVDTGAAAQQQLENAEYDLCLCEGDLPDMKAVDLLCWIRRQSAAVRFMPVIALTSYSYFCHVSAFRDAGAHLVIRKPPSPQILFDRIAWVGRPGRPFVESETYVGPDRRFKSIEPPERVGRRAADISADAGRATGSSISQDETEALAKPMKAIAE